MRLDTRTESLPRRSPPAQGREAGGVHGRPPSPACQARDRRWTHRTVDAAVPCGGVTGRGCGQARKGGPGCRPLQDGAPGARGLHGPRRPQFSRLRTPGEMAVRPGCRETGGAVQPWGGGGDKSPLETSSWWPVGHPGRCQGGGDSGPGWEVSCSAVRVTRTAEASWQPPEP